jgi:hypothetical protein
MLHVLRLSLNFFWTISPIGIKKTVLGLKAQGVPDAAIAARIKHSAPKDANHRDIIDGIVQEKARDDPKAKQYVKKRDNKLKNDIRNEEKSRRKTVGNIKKTLNKK